MSGSQSQMGARHRPISVLDITLVCGVLTLDPKQARAQQRPLSRLQQPRRQARDRLAGQQLVGPFALLPARDALETTGPLLSGKFKTPRTFRDTSDLNDPARCGASSTERPPHMRWSAPWSWGHVSSLGPGLLRTGPGSIMGRAPRGPGAREDPGVPSWVSRSFKSQHAVSWKTAFQGAGDTLCLQRRHGPPATSTSNKW